MTPSFNTRLGRPAVSGWLAGWSFRTSLKCAGTVMTALSTRGGMPGKGLDTRYASTASRRDRSSSPDSSCSTQATRHRVRHRHLAGRETQGHTPPTSGRLLMTSPLGVVAWIRSCPGGASMTL